MPHTETEQRPQRGVVLFVAVSLWAVALLFFALAALCLYLPGGAAGVSGLAALFGYCAVVALGAGLFCLTQSRAPHPSSMRAASVAMLALFAICVGFLVASFLDRAGAHGAIEGFVVLFGGAAAAALLVAGACYVYAAPDAPDREDA